jgi:hypothetical protein
MARTPAALIFPVLLLVTAPASAQSTTFQALRGNSIVLDYRERVTGPRGGSFPVFWRDRIYVSTEGRIFHKMDTRSQNPRATGQQELVGGQQGNAMVWNGSAFVRSFINPKTGVRIRQVVTVSGSGNNAVCSMSLERSGAPGFQYAMEHNGCQVIAGNVFARSR